MEGVPDIKQDEIFIDENDPNVVLGEGAFGIVYRGKCRGLAVAIKMPKAFDISDDELDQFKDEVRMMAKLYHPRIALFMGACIEGSEISVVTELLDGDIEHVLLKDTSISLYQRMVWAMQAAEGMAWVHGAGVIHRDLKPSNMLYSKKENSVKVCDFGFTILVKDKKRAKERKGSPYYIAPEILEGKGASKSSDVYAYGIILHFFITTERVPLKGTEDVDVEEIFSSVCQGARPELPQKKLLCPSSLRALCTSCWDADLTKRPSFEEIIRRFKTDILVDCAVFSSKGRKFWKKCFIRNEELLDDVPWQEFLEQFCLYFATDSEILRPAEASYKCLRELFCQNDSVNLRTFGRMLGFFVPLEKTEWLRAVTAEMREPWFWGDTSREVACQKLGPEPKGTFLVRYASEDSYFTISYVALNQQQKKEIFHTRVVHTYASNHYLIPTTRSGTRACSTLSEVVHALRESTSHLVNRPCPGGPYLSFFADSSVDSGYDFAGGYRVSIAPDLDSSAGADEDDGPPMQRSLKDSQFTIPSHLLGPPSNTPDLRRLHDSQSPTSKKKLSGSGTTLQLPHKNSGSTSPRKK